MIKMMWTNQGMLLADVVAQEGGVITLETPVYVMMGPQGAQMIPVLGLTEAKSVQIKESELLFNAALIDPLPELRNHYSSSFGSGIQLLNG